MSPSEHTLHRDSTVAHCNALVYIYLEYAFSKGSLSISSFNLPPGFLLEKIIKDNFTGTQAYMFTELEHQFQPDNMLQTKVVAGNNSIYRLKKNILFVIKINNYLLHSLCVNFQCLFCTWNKILGELYLDEHKDGQRLFPPIYL